MASITFDGQSFTIDGRRVWLVSGSIHYARVPRELWRDRIRAAKQAGLNCIDTYVFWNLHERERNRFDFTGDLDLRHFVELLRDEGMYCILRPGPYIGAGVDFGGLPPWLLRSEKPVRLRQGHPPFLEACSRYLGAVLEQVRDLQLTTPAEGPHPPAPTANVPGEPAGGYIGFGRGPIILMQVENEWLCHNPSQGDAYLRELMRYLRENGCEVPVSTCNYLWQRLDGAIDTWNARSHLTANLRQLGVVQPAAPRIASEYWTGEIDTWGRKHTPGDAQSHLYDLAQILAAGGQPNQAMFHGGTSFGFLAGRTADTPDSWVTTSYDRDAPLTEAGGRGEKYLATKRICTFASQFSSVFAHLGSESAHAAVATDQPDHPLSVIHLPGTQGEVVFLFKAESDDTRETSVLLPSGLTLPVPLDAERVAWLVLNANLAGVANLDYTNLRPWAMLERRLLVLYGPAGSEGLVSIDDVPMQIQVPEGREPKIERLDDLAVVVLNREMVDAAYPGEDGLVIGCNGFDEDGTPLPLAGWKEILRVGLDGGIDRDPAPAASKPRPPKPTGWQYASAKAMVTGESAAFEKIDGPASLEQLRCDFGYGWYRIGMGAKKTARVLAPQSGDRLHVYSEGKLQAILGLGPGAEYDPIDLKLAGDVVVLADNLGRFSEGHHFGEKKGLFGHLFAVEDAELGEPEVRSQQTPDPFVLSGFVEGRRKGERGPADALVWKIRPGARKPMVLDVRDLPLPGVFLVNDQPIGFYDPELSSGFDRYVLDPSEEEVSTGRNELKFALYGTLERKLDWDRYFTLYQVTQSLSSRGGWAFARWDQPAGSDFGKLPAKLPDQPGWFRAQFKVSSPDQPLWLEPRGMSKGQIYLNGRNLGRYFMSTRDGKAVGPQKLYYLPEPWLKTDEPNELLLFDEHGRSPAKCRLVYNALGPWAK
ncbi:MAG: beta-galactosidase [Phycisphaeraceae bacterium]